MVDVLTDLSAAAVSAAEEANLIAFTPYNRAWPGAERYRGGDIRWCFTDVPAIWCNPVFRAGLEPERADAAIEMLQQKGRARKVPIQWWLRQGDRPADLGERLEAHGFMHSADAAGMAIDLNILDEPAPLPSGLKIEAVQGEEMLETWCRVTVAGFGIPPFAVAAFRQWFERDLKAGFPLRFFLGLRQGKPVATSMSFCAEGVAGIYFVAVLEEARGYGIGKAITLAPLQDAKRAGYRVATLQASSMGEPVYRKLGFKEYSRIGSYLWLEPMLPAPGGQAAAPASPS